MRITIRAERRLNSRFKWAWSTTHTARRVFAFCRWLHIYLSSALFSLLIFFCLTGITLNHLDWFDGKGEQQTTTIELPLQLQQQLGQSEEIPLALLQQFVTEHTGLSGLAKTRIDHEVKEVTFDYSIPAGYAFVTVFIEQGSAEIDQKTGSTIALLNDLHKGRHSGSTWSLVIDLSGLLMLAFALTGLIILLQNNKHRIGGLTLVACGTAMPLLIYFLWVPRLS